MRFVQKSGIFTVFAIALSGLLSAAVAKEAITIAVDHAKVMRIAKPASTIIIGNPAIADANVQNESTLIITGKSYGTTNLIILDAEGEPIADETLVVQAPRGDEVVVWRGSARRQTLTCTPQCETTVRVGDESAVFDAVSGQITSRNGLATEGSGGAGG